ncbi:ABC transporter permease [Acrocarpospora pleiomorpha]|uniref:ABC transporter permease n=1 Tax=Acrocarpospora pleiomorpha TaxID=90975 RepID=A0A5M3XZM6_9ACTN|nr:sugar ABC transporter permease [Acrocarpospora pleiomorpha]GES24933.1 ABC transporter permease [Acrocarpospora pleiomorpha]
MTTTEVRGTHSPSVGMRPARARTRARRQRSRFLLFMVAPAVVYAALVCVYPLVSAVHLSFFDYNLTRGTREPTFVGFDNYVTFIGSDQGRRAIVNTVVFATVAVAVELALGLALALMLWRDTRFNKTVTALLLVPVAFTPLVAALVFKNLYSTSYGPLGTIINTLTGGSTESIVASPATAMSALILVDIWQWTPLIALTLLAGLRSFPDEVTEAASLDGAGYWRRLFSMVLPLLSSYIFIAVIIRTIDAFKVFDSIYAITGGGPGDATTTLNFLAFTEGLKFFNVGYAAAISNILLVIISVFAVIYIASLSRLNRKYEGQ